MHGPYNRKFKKRISVFLHNLLLVCSPCRAVPCRAVPLLITAERSEKLQAAAVQYTVSLLPYVEPLPICPAHRYEVRQDRNARIT
jgi:hypothetical protein